MFLKWLVIFPIICLWIRCASCNPSDKMGFIHKSSVLDQCQAMVQFKAHMNQSRQQSMDFLIQAETALRSREADLKRIQNKAPAAQFKKLRQDLDRDIQALRHKTDLLKSQFKESYAHGLEQIQSCIHEAAHAYALEHGYSLIVDAPIIVYGAPERDLTQDILERVNQALPAVSVDLPKSSLLEK